MHAHQQHIDTGALYDQNKQSLTLNHLHNRSLPQFTIEQPLCFHVQLWNSHPARRHLTPALTIYDNCPKNTDSGSYNAIFANSAHKDNILMKDHLKSKQVFFYFMGFFFVLFFYRWPNNNVMIQTLNRKN